MRSTFTAFVGLFLLLSTAVAFGLPSFASQLHDIKSRLSHSDSSEQQK